MLYSIAGMSRNQADGRYIKKYVGAVLAGETGTINGVPTLYNPNGPVMGQVPSNVAASLISVTDAVVGNNGTKLLRVGGTPYVTGVRCNGTLDAPTATSTAAGLVSLRGSVYDGVADVIAAEIRATSSEAATPANRGAFWQILATDTGTNAPKTVAIVRGGGVGIGEIVSGQSVGRIIPAAGGTYRMRNPSNTATMFEWDGTGIGFFGVTTVARQLVPLGSSANDIINALNNLGLFRLV